MLEIKGMPVSEGIVCGSAYCYIPDDMPEYKERDIEEKEKEGELERFGKAKCLAVSELEEISAHILKDKKEGDEKAHILTAQIGIVKDEDLNGEIQNLIKVNAMQAHAAVESVFDTYTELLGRVESERIKERQADLQDVKRRLIRCLYGSRERGLEHITKPVVLFARSLFPSDTARIDSKKVLGIVTEEGSYTCHSAIIARGYGIPSIAGITGIMDKLGDGSQVILDAMDGRLYINPDEQTSRQYEQRQRQWEQEKIRKTRFMYNEGITPDGVKIQICANLGDGSEGDLEAASFTDGAGLFRTEFLYLGKNSPPDEEEQFRVYKRVLSAYGEKQVILRTLDIGGDKQLEYLKQEKEENPFLGQRAIRLCLANPKLFKIQLRAALRASVYGNLGIMFPMIGSMEDLRRAKAILKETKEELKNNGIPVSDFIQIGTMIEVPSIAMVADILAEEVDFASIGTNDLCQYLCAADRMNTSVSSCYQSFHPAMLRLAGYVGRIFEKAGKPLSICGEMGGDIRAIPFFLGAGIRKLSMSPSAVPGVKEFLSRCPVKAAEELTSELIGMDSQEHILRKIECFLRKINGEPQEVMEYVQ